MIRPASFGDIPALAFILEEGYRNSVYAKLCGIDLEETKRVLVQCLQHMGSKTKTSTYVNVAHGADGVVQGFIVGAVQRVYLVGDKLSASDIWFICRPGAVAPVDSAALLDGFIAWALANPRVVEIKLSTSDAMTSGWKAQARHYTKRGFVPSGDVFVRRIER